MEHTSGFDAPERTRLSTPTSAKSMGDVRGTPSAFRVASPPLAGGVCNPAAVLRLQRSAGNTAAAEWLNGDAPPIGVAQEASPVLDVVGKGGGTPLETEMRAKMEGDSGAISPTSGSMPTQRRPSLRPVFSPGHTQLATKLFSEEALSLPDTGRNAYPRA